MFNPPKLYKLASEAIKELQSNNISPTPEEILLLNRLAELAQLPDDFELLSFCYKSFGNLKVYPLTLGAKLWLQLYEKEHPLDPVFQSFAIIYAMAHSRDMSAFVFLNDKECQETIYKFASGINLTEDEVKDLIAKVTPEKVEVKKKDNDRSVDEDFTLIPALSILMNIYGKDTQYWLWQESEEVVSRYIQEAIKIKTEKPIKQEDRSLVAFMELKRQVGLIRKSRQPEPVVDTKDKVI